MTAVSTPSEYDAFAPFYDDFTSGSDYETWTGHVLDLLSRLGRGGTTVLDVACGTGKSFMPFLQRGFDVTGCDISAGMLAEAARKAPEVPLLQADARELPAIGRFDLVTCFDDSVNYLLEEDDLARAVASMAANLATGGTVLFDLNTLLTFRTTFACDSVTVRGGTVFAWRGETEADAGSGCRALARIEIFSPHGEDLYEHVAVCHAQRHFPPEHVIALIEGAGLECLGVYGVRLDGSLDDVLDELSHPKVLYAARPAKGGESQ